MLRTLVVRTRKRGQHHKERGYFENGYASEVAIFKIN